MTTRIPNPPIAGQGLSATYIRNLLSCIRSMTPIAGPGIVLERKPNGTVFSSTAKSSRQKSDTSTLEPFTVRWFSHDNDGKDPSKGEWQIYLPFGCAVLNDRPYMVDTADNARAKDNDGEEIRNWYKVEPPDGKHGKEENFGLYKGVASPLYVVFQPWPRMKATCDPDDDFGQGYERMIVANVGEYSYTDSEGNKTTVKSATQIFTGQKKVSCKDDSAFAIVYKAGSDGKSSDYDEKVKFYPFVTNQKMMFGRVQVENEEESETKVDGWEEVYLEITHDTEEFTIKIGKGKDDKGDKSKNSDDKTYIRIYKMKNNDVVEDSRTDIEKIPYYS